MKVTKKILVATMAALLLVGSEARAGIYTPDPGTGGPITSGVGLVSTITSSGFLGNIGSLTVTLDISGGNNGDLYGYLSYNGVLVTILNRPGVSPSNPFGASGSGFNVTISDLGSVNLNSTTGTFGSQVTGTYNVNGDGTPGNNGTLAFGSAYNGLDPNGVWTLYLENGVSGGDPSTLVSWSIGINAVPEPTNVAMGIFGVCAIAGRVRAGLKKSRADAKNGRVEMKLLRRETEDCNGRGPFEGFCMKSAAVILVSAGLAVSAFAGDVPSVNQLTETLSRGPWAELPVRVVSVVRHAKAKDRKETTIAAIKAALGLNPASASAVVGSVARSVPDMAAVAAEAAAGEQNKQAPEIALAAAAANHAAVADIVAGVCHAVPAQYESIAIAAALAVPDSGRDILLAVGKAEPDMKSPIDQVMADYNGYVPSVAFVLDRAKPGGVTIAPLANNHTNRPTNPGYTRYNKYPIPAGGFQGQPPQGYDVP